MLLEHRIARLEEQLPELRVIEKKEISSDMVSVGSMAGCATSTPSRQSNTASSARRANPS